MTLWTRWDLNAHGGILRVKSSKDWPQHGVCT